MPVGMKDGLSVAKILLQYVPPMLLSLIEVMEQDISQNEAGKQVKDVAEKKRRELLDAVEREPEQPEQ